MLSSGAYNALLKTLEEPPEYVIFILATTEVQKIPVTILSRCQRYDFHRITIDTITARLEELMAAINLANCRTVVDGLTLTERIARKDCLRLRLEAYRELVQAASQTARRATRSEIRILSAVDVRALQGKVDAMARELRLLDNQLQQINWTTEL